MYKLCSLRKLELTIRVPRKNSFNNFVHDSFGHKVAKTLNGQIFDLALWYISLLYKIHPNIKFAVENWLLLKIREQQEPEWPL